MRLFAFFISLLISVNFADAETYKCSAVSGMEGILVEDPYRPSNDKIPNMLLKTNGDVAIVIIGKREPELYSLVAETKVRLIYQWHDIGWLHTVYLDKSATKPLIYYNMIDPAGFRVVYNYECSVN